MPPRLRATASAISQREEHYTMVTIFKGRARRVAAALAALGVAIAISGAAVLGTASAVSAQPVEPASLPAPLCTTGTGSTGDNPTARTYAWARCNDRDGNPDVNYWSFMVVWSCTGENYMRYGTWHVADNTTLRGYCPAGKYPDISTYDLLSGEVD